MHICLQQDDLGTWIHLLSERECWHSKEQTKTKKSPPIISSTWPAKCHSRGDNSALEASPAVRFFTAWCNTGGSTGYINRQNRNREMKTLWNNTWIWSMFFRIQHSPWGYLSLVALPIISHLPFSLSCAFFCGKKKLQHIRFSLLFTPCNRLKCALGCALGYSSSRTKEIKSLVGTVRKPFCLKPRLAEFGFTYWNKVTEQKKKPFVQTEQRLNPADSNTIRSCCSEESHCASVNMVWDLHLKSCTWKLMELQKKQWISA